MATKLKKYYDELRQTPADSKNWRNIGFVGWLSFFLSVSLLLTIAGCYFGPRAAAAMGSTSYRDLLTDDYKDTTLFRDTVISSVYQLSRVKTDGSTYDSATSYYSFHNELSYAQQDFPFPGAAEESDKLISETPSFDYNTLKKDPFRIATPILTLQIENSRIVQVSFTQGGKNIDSGGTTWIPALRSKLQNLQLPDLTDYSGSIEKTTPIKNRTLYLSIANSMPYNNVYNSYNAEKQLYGNILRPGMLILTAALLVISIFFYTGKQHGDRVIATFLGHIPVEIKVLLLFLLCIVPATISIDYSSMAVEISNLLTRNLTLARCLFYLVWYVWIAYLVITCIRYKTFAKLSLFNRWQEKSNNVLQKTPIANQIQRWLKPLFILVDICMTPCVLFFISINVAPGGFNFFLRIFFFGGLAAAIIYLEYRIWKKSKFLGIQMAKLTEQIRLIRSGAQPQPIHVGGCDQLSAAAYDLNAVQDGIEAAVNERVRSERMKVELVTNVSHDLKTPLTSIISYVDLLGQEELSPTARDYVQILAQKSDRLKAIVQDVFDISKAVSGNLAVNNKTLDLAKLLRQTLADMDEQISAAPLTFRVQLPKQPVWIYSDGDRLYRVFQNLIQNAVRYSLENSRVYITLAVLQGYAHAKVRNTSKHEIGDAQALLERFTRGDKNRTTEGSGLGLSIAQSFTQACSGTFSVSAQADLFIAEVVLPLGQAPQTNNSSGTVLEPVLADSPKNTNTPAS